MRPRCSRLTRRRPATESPEHWQRGRSNQLGLALNIPFMTLMRCRVSFREGGIVCSMCDCGWGRSEKQLRALTRSCYVYVLQLYKKGMWGSCMQRNFFHVLATKTSLKVNLSLRFPRRNYLQRALVGLSIKPAGSSLLLLLLVDQRYYISRYLISVPSRVSQIPGNLTKCI